MITINRIFEYEGDAVTEYSIMTSGITGVAKGAETYVLTELWMGAKLDSNKLSTSLNPHMQDYLLEYCGVKESSFRNSLVSLQKKGLVTKDSKRGVYNLNQDFFQELDGSDLELKLNIKLD